MITGQEGGAAISPTVKYLLAYLLALQVGLGFAIPQRWLYHHRIPFELFREDPRLLDRVLDRIQWQIRRERLKDYVIILGDSVSYSGPGGPEQSIGAVMEEMSREAGRPLRVFNLALPSMQVGDLYVVLLKLKERSIATDRVVINLLYAGFVARAPAPPIAFWLADDLRRLDPEAWQHHRSHLAANRRVATDRSPSALFDRYVVPRIPLLAYRPVLKQRLMGWTRPGELHDTRPWTEKPDLPQLLAGPAYHWVFDPTPFDMTGANPQIYFLERILRLTRDSRPLLFLTPTNQALVKERVSHPGYQQNLDRIDAWFRRQPVTYRNWESALDPGLFTDHLHLTPEGYRHLAAMLLRELEPGG
ncbi:MAG: hypothetical protein ACOY93_01530 [Bacillota bacterium]